MAWQVQDAKARFSEFLDASLRDGPQVVTRRGVEAAVLVPIEEWRRLKQAARPTLKQLLLAPECPIRYSGSQARRAPPPTASWVFIDVFVRHECRVRAP